MRMKRILELTETEYDLIETVRSKEYDYGSNDIKGNAKWNGEGTVV